MTLIRRSCTVFVFLALLAAAEGFLPPVGRSSSLSSSRSLDRWVPSSSKAHERDARARPGSPSELFAKATYKNFEDMLQQQAGPILVDFYATWCGPCQMMSEILTEVGPQMKDELKIVKIDSDKYPSLAAKFAVAGLPTLILFTDGKEYQRIEGVLPGDKLITQLRYWLQEAENEVGAAASPRGDACTPPKDACAPPPRDACASPPAACSPPRDACAPPSPQE